MQEIQKGQHYAAKYRSKDSGDVIVCRIHSVRTSREKKNGDKDEGIILSRNLLTDKISTKREKVFRQRMKRISKKQAKKIMTVFKKTGNKEKTRDAAVASPVFGGDRQLELLSQEPKMDLNKSIRELLESRGCEIKEEAGIWTISTPEGEQWDFTNPQKVEKPDPTTKIIVWASWETVENFGTPDSDYLGDGDALCLGAFDTVAEAEGYIQMLGSNKHLIDGCPGV